ncbi:VapB-type antitoxin [Acidianus infernus]|uniref:VapB-type antitoxin n=1 Tax=Acidianus infernus TaxID=12915 RepID=A0A6A9QHB2_ACIIN|nr:VapB-type antitoxin [Acidianus infernus]MUM65705.1 VapB-type antitoxin [Acidianus infernus]
MSDTIRVSKEVKRELIKIMGELQIERGEKVDFNDVIEFLLSLYRKKNPEILRSLVGIVPNLSAEELEEERRKEIEHEKEKYGV